jgi:hypothetical protein
MAEKKVKIDLKSRLGRASSHPSPSTPPRGAAPTPGGIAPPPGLMTPSGVPPPPFKATGPKVDKSDPFAAMSREDAPRARAADIKVEISADVAQAQKKSRLGALIVGVIMALVGGGLGFVWGGVSEKDNQAKVAVKGAHDIAADLEKSNNDVKAIAEKVAATSKLLFQDKKFPDGFSQEMSGLKLSFDTNSIAGRNINRLKPGTIRNLIEYATSVQDLDKRRERLARMMEANKPDVLALLEASQHPRMSYAVFMGKGEKGPVATFVKIKTPFEFEKPWPDKFGIVGIGEVIDAERYKSGEPFVKPGATPNAKPTIYAAPIEPDGVARAFPNDIGKRVEAELAAATTLIAGSASETDPDAKSGLLKLGEELIKELRAVGK